MGEPAALSDDDRCDADGLAKEIVAAVTEDIGTPIATIDEWLRQHRATAANADMALLQLAQREVELVAQRRDLYKKLLGLYFAGNLVLASLDDGAEPTPLEIEDLRTKLREAM